MKDSIHKRLTDQIRKTMGRYEPAYEPGSWEEFQRLRRKRQQRQPLVWFRYALAACLLLGVLGVPVWLYVGRQDSESLAKNQPKTGFSGKKTVPSLVEKHRVEGAGLIYKKEPVEPDGKPLLSLSTPGVVRDPGFAPKVVLDPGPKGDLDAAKSGFRKSPLGPGSRTTLGARPVPRTTLDARPEPIAVRIRPDESISQTGSYDFITPRSIPITQRPLRPLGLPLSLWTDQPVVAKIDRSKMGQKPIWGVSLAPQSVYAAGSSASPAVGGGLFSEIPISRRFSLSTGLSMAQQKFGTAGPEVFVVSTIPQLISTSIRLTAVDLPLNIRFRPKKSANLGFYAEAGLSSVAFLNEQYAYTYQQQKEVTVVVMGTNGQEQTTTQFVTAQETINQAAPAFQKIYWGRILNLSIGVERRIGTQFRLSAEPYLKYPIGPFTRENLLLGSGGVSLRLGFQSVR
ncbi:outer membrane beta-barrel protein [Larkinella humicola]|uniref:PorT family protein n=1 Tax=Larkinella humicola TaxID=2607654 RepID=A0A5N1JCJ8_9BACT|nr:outer membrane beta-barrel protein [Larkinella humicola]KAA9346680.1 PorT family protein [Larkinella humicola]